MTPPPLEKKINLTDLKKIGDGLALIETQLASLENEEEDDSTLGDAVQTELLLSKLKKLGDEKEHLYTEIISKDQLHASLLEQVTLFHALQNHVRTLQDQLGKLTAIVEHQAVLHPSTLVDTIIDLVVFLRGLDTIPMGSEEECIAFVYKELIGKGIAKEQAQRQAVAICKSRHK
jgi:hypothetical protein